MKKVVLTGGASGMGRAVAKELAKNGFYVYSLDIKKAKEEIENICQIVADVTSMESLQKAYDTVKKETESLDAVLNFAGIIMMNSLIEMSEEDFVKIFNINLFGVFRVNKIFAPMVIKNKGKILITTSELAGTRVLPFNAIYSVSKKALDAYAEGLRLELGLLGVQVVTLRPGAVKTELIDHSNTALDTLVDNTNLYKGFTKNFKKIVDGQQGKAVPAEKIGKLVLKILNRKKPKCVYYKNASKKLKLLKCVSQKTELAIIKLLLK